MIEVAGIWETGWNVPMTESVQWEMMLREFGVERLNIVPVSGILAPWGGTPRIVEYPSFDALVADRPGLDVVVLDEHAKSTLQEFEHPEDVLYMFGKASDPVQSTLHDIDYHAIRIDTVRPGCLWAHQACAVVLYDRMLKQ